MTQAVKAWQTFKEGQASGALLKDFTCSRARTLMTVAVSNCIDGLSGCAVQAAVHGAMLSLFSMF